MNIELTDILVFIYSFIGVIFTVYYWNKYYNKEYNKAKEIGEVQDSMACIYMLFVWVLWPLFAFKEIFIKIKKLLKNCQYE